MNVRSSNIAGKCGTRTGSETESSTQGCTQAVPECKGSEGGSQSKAKVSNSCAWVFFLWSFFVLILQHWDVFKYVTEVFILVPALLGLKGNLEMTLASRLSTAVSIQGMLRSRMSVFWGAGRDVHVHMNAVTTQRRGWS